MLLSKVRNPSNNLLARSFTSSWRLALNLGLSFCEISRGVYDVLNLLDLLPADVRSPRPSPCPPFLEHCAASRAPSTGRNVARLHFI